MTNDEYQQLAQAAALKLRAAGIGVGFHNQTWEAPAGGVLTVDAVREFVDAHILTPNPEAPATPDVTSHSFRSSSGSGPRSTS